MPLSQDSGFFIGQIGVYRAVIKRLSSRASPQTGVAIPIKSAESGLKLEEIATPVCALARNDTIFVGVLILSDSVLN